MMLSVDSQVPGFPVVLYSALKKSGTPIRIHHLLASHGAQEEPWRGWQQDSAKLCCAVVGARLVRAGRPQAAQRVRIQSRSDFAADESHAPCFSTDGCCEAPSCSRGVRQCRGEVVFMACFDAGCCCRPVCPRCLAVLQSGQRPQVLRRKFQRTGPCM